MKIVQGDLIELAKQGHFDVIVHGCNCLCVMNSGIAKQIRENFPNAYLADLDTLKRENKLGTYSKAITGELTILNAYTQYKYGRDKNVVYADYKAIAQVFKSIAKHFPDKRIGYPKIGAGLANGNWDVIKDIIDYYLEGMNHTLVILGDKNEEIHKRQ